jgi:hypothetical protein
VSWRDRAERNRIRAEVEARRYRKSEGVQLRYFFRFLLAPVGVVVLMLLPQPTLPKTVLVAAAALALLLLLGFAKVARARRTNGRDLPGHEKTGSPHRPSRPSSGAN